MNDEKNTLGTWLFNPFHFIAGWQALALGLGVILASGFLASLGNSHFDGLLDFHAGSPALFPPRVFALEGLVDWLVFSILLLPAGLMISTSKIRAVDVVGTQALARFPYLFSAALAWPCRPVLERVTTYFVARVKGAPTPLATPDAVVFGALLVVIILMVVWMYKLMYRAFSVSCNVEGRKPKIVFVAAVILGEILTKLAILKLVY